MGIEKGDKLDVLLALVDVYEARRWPIAIDETFVPIDVLVRAHHGDDPQDWCSMEDADRSSGPSS